MRRSIGLSVLLAIGTMLAFSSWLPANDAASAGQGKGGEVIAKPTPTPAPKKAPPPKRSAPAPSLIQRGVLKIVTLPMPHEAKEWQARGDSLAPKDGAPFRVRVTIDEMGKVIAAEIGDGHPALTRAAMSDATQQHVTPATSNGRSVKSVGWIDYVFTDSPDKNTSTASPSSDNSSARVSPSSSSSKPAMPPNPLLPLHSFDFVTVTLDSYGKLKSRETKSANAYTEDLGSGVKLEMVAIPPGEFMMGSPETEANRSKNEGPQHRVRIGYWFFIGKFEVTQTEWRALMGTNLSEFKGCDECPAEHVSWNDAVEFCRKLSARTGHEYRLPSEAEWEYAARAGTTTPFAFGDTITPEIVNYDGNYPYASAAKGTYRQKTAPGGSLGVANAFGAYDMHGNVWEWCQDWYHDSYAAIASDAPTDGSAWVTGGEQKQRVTRGGSWFHKGTNSRSAYRNADTPDIRDPRSGGYGFRVVAIARAQ
jgi:formylglycine-generating enzyme required for sulfatase activity